MKIRFHFPQLLVDIMKKNQAVIMLLFLSLILVTVWFWGGRLIAGAEEGLTFFAPEKVISKFNSPWPNFGLGIPSPAYLPRLPFLWLVEMLNRFLPGWLSEAVVYFFFMASGSIGMYLLAQRLLSNQKYLNLIAAVFYLLNLYSMTQVWNRQLTPGMFIWAYLPLFLFFYIKWLDSGRIKWLLIWLFSAIVFSNAFCTASFIFTVWLPAALWVIVGVLQSNRKEERVNLLVRSAEGMAAWFLINIWWVYPAVHVGAGFFSNIFSWRQNFDVVKAVSSALSYWNYFVLYHDSYLQTTGPWGAWYHSIWAHSIAWTVFVAVLLGVIKSSRRRNFTYLLALFLVSFFLVKGTKPPLGAEFYAWLFSVVPQMGILRNPYEKLGSDWLLGYSLFFVLGVGWIVARFKRAGGYFGGLLVISACGILVWPMWTGRVYTPDTKVEVPAYYKEANDFINAVSDSDGRLLILPLIPGDAAKYTWGYGGIEASTFLFDKNTISQIFRDELADRKYWEIYNRSISKQSFSDLLGQINVDYLVLRDDLDPASGASPSAEIRTVLERDSRIKYLATFGKVSVYKYLGEIGLFEAQGVGAPQIIYSKISPTHYQIQVKNAQADFDLIYKTSFHPLWRAKINNEILDVHLLAYNYANKWMVSKRGDYTIDVVFAVWPWQ